MMLQNSPVADAVVQIRKEAHKTSTLVFCCRNTDATVDIPDIYAFLPFLVEPLLKT